MVFKSPILLRRGYSSVVEHLTANLLYYYWIFFLPFLPLQKVEKEEKMTDETDKRKIAGE